MPVFLSKQRSGVLVCRITVGLAPRQVTPKIKVELKEKTKEKYKDFLSQKRTLADFKVGLVVPSKLLPVTIKGGVVLRETDFTLRDI